MRPTILRPGAFQLLMAFAILAIVLMASMPKSSAQTSETTEPAQTRETRDQPPPPPQPSENTGNYNPVAEKNSAGDLVVAGELIVTFKANTSSASKKSINQEAEARTLDKWPRIRAQHLSFPQIKNERGQEARKQALKRKEQVLEQDPNVESVDYNYLRELSSVPNDPYFADGTQWGLNKIDASQAWTKMASYGTESTGVVGVLDSGFDMGHPDLANITWEYDFFNNDGSAEPDYGLPGHEHGTHVAGTVGASTNNDLGVAGAYGPYPLAIHAAKVCGPVTWKDPVTLEDKEDLQCPDAPVIDALNYFANNHDTNTVDALNLSLGGFGHADEEITAYQNAVDAVWNNDISVIAAAGNGKHRENDWKDQDGNIIQHIGDNNDIFPFYPASLDHVISVAATDQYDGLALFSNYGNSVDVAAPGVDIYSTIPTFNSMLWDYDYSSGTSMAAPHVAAVAAMIAVDESTKTGVWPTSSFKDARIREATDPLGTPVQNGAFITNGRINASDALGTADTTAPKGTIKINGGKTYTTSRSVNLSLSATDSGSGVAHMRLLNDGGSWTPWMSYTTSKSWTLRDAQGARTVYVQYRDKVGYVSTTALDRIKLDTIHPRVVKISPTAGAKQISPFTNVKVTFSEAMKPATITKKNIILRRDFGKGKYQLVRAKVTYNSTSKTATLNPSVKLAAGATYVATVFQTNKDLAGNRLDQYPGLQGDNGLFWRFQIRK